MFAIEDYCSMFVGFVLFEVFDCYKIQESNYTKFAVDSSNVSNYFSVGTPN